MRTPLVTLSHVVLLVLLATSLAFLRGQTGERRRLEVPGSAQSTQARPKLGARGITEPDEPAHLEPAATDFRDAKYKLSFHVPAGWNFSREDGDLSNFSRDVRSARARLNVRGVAAINYNPYPVTTFSGATFYYSVLSRTDAATCSAEAAAGFMKKEGEQRIAGKVFTHGHDQHGSVCTEARDDVYTGMQGKTCLRFDLVINTFCAQTSGAMEITRDQLADFNKRLATILDSVRLDGK